MNKGRLVRIAVLATVISVSGTAAVYFATQTPTGNTVTAVSAPGGTGASTASYGYERVDGPARTLVRDGSGVLVATLTDGSRTVMITGPSRIFREPNFTTAEVSTTAWIRLAPQPWAAGAEQAAWFQTWLKQAVADSSPDILAIATEYLDSTPAKNAKKLRVSGDATFGPDSVEGRLERSDFYDYLGVNWDFPDGVHENSSPERYGSLDCSGFVRMVYGYRSGYPLRGSNTAGPGLPRRAWAMSELGPGTAVIRDTGSRAVDYARLQPGDVLFFNLEPLVGTQVSHTGIYLGIDGDGHHRVLSSRKVANGPTFGDAGGTSLIDQGGKYSLAFRAAKRL
jgi:cell wall-associated NlpC family hydrolase